MTRILVTGATGTVGSALVPAVRERGAEVTALIRDPARPVDGVRNVLADLADPVAVGAALDGVDVAFLNSPSAENAAAVQIGFVDAAERAGVSRIVLLSQFAAHPSSPVRFLRWHAEVERHLRDSGVAHTVLRPNLYMQGLLAFGATLADGWFAAPIGDAAVSLIDTRDVAEVAAVALVDAATAGHTYTLTGPRAVTHDEIAAELARATGREVAFHDVAPEQFAMALEGVLPPWQLAGLVEDYAHYARGEAAEVTSAVQALTGRPPRDIAEFAADHAAAFIGR